MSKIVNLFDYSEIDGKLAHAMRLDSEFHKSTSVLKEFLTEQIKRFESMGKIQKTAKNKYKAFGPRSLMQEIFGSWLAIPEQLRDIIETDKTQTDPLGRAHNRLASMISKIQRIDPVELLNNSIPSWEELLCQDLAKNRYNTISKLRSIIIKNLININED